MLSHFDKLKTPLKSVFEYPHLEAQHNRFSRLGWPNVEVISLWDVWTNNNWISAAQRRKLDLVEPFDEWEEFALFANHYCVVTARNFDIETQSSNSYGVTVESEPYVPRQLSPKLLFNAYSGAHGKRRFGSTLKMRSALGEQVFANTFGLGTNNRLKSCDIYSFDSSVYDAKLDTAGPGSRVCHAVIDLGRFGGLLVGGRASPATALRDCWHFSVEQNKWSPIEDLPVPLYRHAVTQLGRSNLALLIGGRSDSSTVFAGCLIHKPGSGWIECDISGSVYRPVFGAMLVSFEKHHYINNDSGSPMICFEGILAGGLLDDGTVARQLFRWSLELSGNDKPTISFEPIVGPSNSDPLVCRFGASSLLLGNERIAIVGGVLHDRIVSRVDEVLIVEFSGSKLESLSRCSPSDVNNPSGIPRPLLVGAAISSTEHNRLLIMGGGATVSNIKDYIYLCHKRRPAHVLCQSVSLWEHTGTKAAIHWI